MELIIVPIGSDRTLEELMSPEQRKILEHEGQQPVSKRRARQLLTGCFLLSCVLTPKISRPVCVAAFGKLR
jgi:hypothetical protein